jgi:FkbM family methyltransferase
MSKSAADLDVIKHGRDCWPVGFRDWLAAHCIVRVGRLDCFSWVREVRRYLALSVSCYGEMVEFETAYGFTMFLPRDYKSLILLAMRARLFPPKMTEILQHEIQPGDVFVDGGSHLGFYTLLAARKFEGNGLVLSFEPQPDTFDLLKKNVERNGFAPVVRLEKMALTNAKGQFAFNKEEESMLSSLILDTGAQRRVIWVSGIRLDDFLTERGQNRVDIIKLDLEGAEPMAFDGMTASLQSARLLIFEINKPQLARLDADPLELIDRVVRLGSFHSITFIDEDRNRECDWNRIDFVNHLEKSKFVNVVCRKQTDSATVVETRLSSSLLASA